MAIPAALIAAVAPQVIGGILGNKKADDKYTPLVKDAIAKLQGIKVPSVEEQKVQLQNYVLQGLLTPEQYEAALQDLNAYDEINLNPEYRQAQEDSLSKIKDTIEAGGLDAIDRAKIMGINDQVNASEASRLKAIQDNARTRGISGSGIEMGAALRGDQEARNTAYKQGMGTAALAAERRMQAIKDQATLGNTLESTQYKQESDRAAAANAMAAANQSAKNVAEQWNAQTRQNTNVGNLDAKQAVANANTKNENDTRLRNSGLLQSEFDNKVKQATAALGPTQDMAKMAQGKANADTAGDNALFNNLGGVFGKAASDYYAGQKPVVPSNAQLENEAKIRKETLGY